MPSEFVVLFQPISEPPTFSGERPENQQKRASPPQLYRHTYLAALLTVSFNFSVFHQHKTRGRRGWLCSSCCGAWSCYL